MCARISSVWPLTYSIILTKNNRYSKPCSPPSGLEQQIRPPTAPPLTRIYMGWKLGWNLNTGFVLPKNIPEVSPPTRRIWKYSCTMHPTIRDTHEQMYEIVLVWVSFIIVMYLWRWTLNYSHLRCISVTLKSYNFTGFGHWKFKVGAWDPAPVLSNWGRAMYHSAKN